MKHTYKINTDKYLIYKTHQGEVTVEGEIKLLNTIFEDPKFRPGMDAICDFTKAKINWNRSDLEQFQAYVARIKHITGNCKWALIFPEGGDTETAQVYIALHESLEDTTIEIKLFNSIDDAHQWIKTKPVVK